MTNFLQNGHRLYKLQEDPPAVYRVATLQHDGSFSWHTRTYYGIEYVEDFTPLVIDAPIAPAGVIAYEILS